ncbi:Endonuclease/Exonuclease/phosphatase family protein [Streptomyces sp. YIM 130001]|uniref:endonuclease/exonuclease/phosphatase family protein n=1 Tax=Streptomyces sp. YIM 130001 TaxID=2259644 RepID=UPI000E650973|nr:endonuclease/exonuclease/phosphatase family protein [Streptomyces sp. YIM 130001]RII19809.1 Endonuclease/Exonuclease/phosphatase family protein [Streptomyces sp. YIM 130001]
MTVTRRIFLTVAATAVAAATTTASAQAGPDRAAAGELRVLTMNLWHGGAQVNDGLDKQVAVIEKHRPDVVGLQETSGHAAKDLAERLGWDHWQSDGSLGVISRHPITSDAETIGGGAGAGVRIRIDESTGQEVELWTAHLGYTPYGPYDACFDQMPVDTIMEREAESGRTGQATELAEKLKGKIADADTTPVLLVGDFNSPSHLDWTDANQHCGYGQVDWPATKIVADAGMTDSYRQAHPDPAADPATTWSPIYPNHDGSTGEVEPQDRIDFITYAGSGLGVQDSSVIVDGDPAPYPDQADNAWPTDHAAVLTTFSVG